MILVEQYGLLAQNHLAQGVNEVMAKSSAIYEALDFKKINSLTYDYNVVDELPEVGYRAINQGFYEGTADVRQLTERLAILGGDADVDVQLTFASPLNDLRAIQTELKAKSCIRQFDMDFFKGTGLSNTIKGLDKRVAEGEAGIEITKAFGTEALTDLETIYEVMAKVNGCTHLIMSKSMNIKFNMMLHKCGMMLNQGTDSFGTPTAVFNGARVVLFEDVLIPAGKIYALNLNANNGGIGGITTTGLTVRDLGELDTKPVYRTRIEFPVGIYTPAENCFCVLNTSTTLKAKAK